MKKTFLLFIVCVVAFVGCTSKTISSDVLSWQEQYDLGIRYLNEGNYEEAIIAFTEAIKIEPKKYEAYLERANAYLKIGDEENLEYARADFEKVIEIDETVAEAYGGLAEIYVSKNEPEKALEILENAEEKVGNASKDLYENKDVVLYSPEEQITVNLKELKTYKEDGWYTEPVVTMYAADGRTRITLESEVEAYKNVGWYLQYNLDENEKGIINSILYGIGNKSLGEISQISDTFLVESIIDTSKSEYNAFGTVNTISYSDSGENYIISEQEMKAAMNYIYGRNLEKHVACGSIINTSDKDYVYYAPNGRGKYGEIKIHAVAGDDSSVIVKYSYDNYNYAESSVAHNADASVDLIAEFCRNQNEKYPFKLLSVYDSERTIADYKRIYRDTELNQTVLNNYFVVFSLQDYSCERFKFNDDGTLEMVEISLNENNQKYYSRTMGIYTIDHNEIEISKLSNGEYEHTCTLYYCEEENYFYNYEFTEYKETYSPEPYVYLPVDPNDKGKVKRLKVFTYIDAPTIDTLVTDFEQKFITVD